MSAAWPKLTGDWTVANPAVGTFGTLDTDAAAKKVVVALTRSGRVLAYEVAAGACAPASWPRFHHDNANSGDTRRDAVGPGKPGEATLAGGTLSFSAPGDDLLWGTAARYEVRTADEPISGDSFAGATPVAVTAAPKAAGAQEALELPAADLKRYVAVRAVDEQGNVGRPQMVDRGPEPTATPDRTPEPSVTPAPTPGVDPTPTPTATPKPDNGGGGCAEPGSGKPPCAPGAGSRTTALAPGCARRIGRLRLGMSTAAARRAAPKRVRIAKGIYRASRRSTVVFSVGAGKVIGLVRVSSAVARDQRAARDAIRRCRAR